MGILKQGILVAVAIVVYSQVTRLFKKDLPTNVGGFTHPDFKLVADVFRANVASGKEPGGALAVYYKGELVVDLWGGYADVSSERPWSEDTVTLAYSCTKGIAAIVAAKLVEKGMLAYDKPVADYWPEFAQNGKENVTVEMLLSHQAGVVFLDEPVSMRDLKENLGEVAAKLAKQKPVWPPGAQFGYHALTFGLYVDRLIQMADKKGRDTETIFQEEIAKPLDIDFHMHLPLRDFHRAARLESPSPMGFLLEALVYSRRYLKPFYQIVMKPDSWMAKSLTAVKEFSVSSHILNNPYNRDVTISSVSGTGTARGLAKIYGMLANDGSINGKQGLSRDLVDRLSTPVVSGMDSVFATAGERSIGPGTLFQKNKLGDVMVGHTGHGGQVAVGDCKNRIGIGYLTNHLTVNGAGDDPRYIDLENAVYDCLVKLKQ